MSPDISRYSRGDKITPVENHCITWYVQWVVLIYIASGFDKPERLQLAVEVVVEEFSLWKGKIPGVSRLYNHLCIGDRYISCWKELFESFSSTSIDLCPCHSQPLLIPPLSYWSSVELIPVQDPKGGFYFYIILALEGILLFQLSLKECTCVCVLFDLVLQLRKLRHKYY